MDGKEEKTKGKDSGEKRKTFVQATVEWVRNKVAVHEVDKERSKKLGK